MNFSRYIEDYKYWSSVGLLLANTLNRNPIKNGTFTHYNHENLATIDVFSTEAISGGCTCDIGSSSYKHYPHHDSLYIPYPCHRAFVFLNIYAPSSRCYRRCHYLHDSCQ